MIIPTRREYWLLGSTAAIVLVLLCGAVVLAGLAAMRAVETTDGAESR